MIEILTEWTDALRVPLHHKRHIQYQVKKKTFFFCWSKSNRCLYSSHRRLLRFCFLFIFVNRSHCFSVGKLYRYFRSIRFSSCGLCLWNFVKSISLLYRFRSRWQYICLDFICEAEWIVCWSRYVTDYHMSRRVTGTCEKLIKIRQISSVTCRFVRDPFCVGCQKKAKIRIKVD